MKEIKNIGHTSFSTCPLSLLYIFRDDEFSASKDRMFIKLSIILLIYPDLSYKYNHFYNWQWTMKY